MINIKEKLYITDIKNIEDNWKDNIKNLPKWRIEKVNSYKVEKPQKLSYLASILYEKAIKDIDNNIDIDTIKISYKNEKPYIENDLYKDIHFNISHSDKKVILAISSEEVGCDIEKIKDFDINLAKRFFTKKEYELLDSIKDKEIQKNIFYKMWTYKESFLKLNSQGITKGLANVDFSDVDYDTALSKEYNITFFIDGDNKYYLHNIYDEKYMIAICINKSTKHDIIYV